jgi:hypothetical protein
MFFYRATTQQNCVLATIRCEEFVAAVVALAPKLFDREERGCKGTAASNTFRNFFGAEQLKSDEAVSPASGATPICILLARS